MNPRRGRSRLPRAVPVTIAEAAAMVEPDAQGLRAPREAAALRACTMAARVPSDGNAPALCDGSARATEALAPA